MSDRPRPQAPEPPAPGLPLPWRLGILALLVAQFLVLGGPVWKHLFDWDRTILWSYITIPPLVLGALALTRRLALKSFILETLGLAFLKFSITACILIAVLVTKDPPRRPPGAEPTRSLAAAPVSPPLAAATEPAHDGPVLRHDGRRFQPVHLTVRAGQAVSIRSADAVLHTALVRRPDGRPVANLPLLASGLDRRLRIPRELHGTLTVDCAVHGAREGRAFLHLVP